MMHRAQPSVVRALLGSGILAALCFAALPNHASAQPSPDGYDWVTVGDPGNQPWLGFSDPLTPTYGRGSVPYEYRIGRTEVTTAQWVEFLNSAMARPDSLGFPVQWWTMPLWWGAMDDPAYSGPGRRFVVRTDIPDAGMLPVSGISWRMSAVLCNWLHNDKSAARDAFMTGAYDVGTFSPVVVTNTPFTDQATRSPGAKYWIPSLDEHMKASHYDPHRHGPGQAGWWEHAGMSDVPLIYAPPQSFGGDGSGQANAIFRLPNSMELLIPLGAYPDVVSPWGLLDTAGGTREWTEEIYILNNRGYRVTEGSSRSISGDLSDNVWGWGANYPSSVRLDMGVRLASAVPCPADYNNDGGVDGADVEAFFLDWQLGQSAADVNFDGGVDGQDVEIFFVAWEASGCG
ncbi:MAG: SUMF1/EgtB/PvdO family nonheme iron enzyme [Phycisphaeraceae bacterium]|nr:SUMF1/EgtB/PvdO family nonheme iron enzyme [Phycisphaeraceae bacterium]